MSVHDPDQEAALGELTRFRHEFYRGLTARADALCELTDAVVYTDGPVRSLVGLSLAPDHRRGHGALYDGINHGRLDIAGLPNLVATQRLPKAADGRITLAVDICETREAALARLGRGDPARRRILIALLDRPSYSGHFSELELTRSNVSNHLACLGGCGLVMAPYAGRKAPYALVSSLSRVQGPAARVRVHRGQLPRFVLDGLRNVLPYGVCAGYRLVRC